MTDSVDIISRSGLWQKLLLILSVVCMAGGAAMYGAGKLSDDSSGTTDTPKHVSTDEGGGEVDPSLVTGLDGTHATDGGSGDPTEEDADASGATTKNAFLEWSPTVFRLGFSCFVGFCMAYALRMFLKATLLMCGILFLLLFGLQYVELITVNWTRMEGFYDQFTPWVRDQFSSFTSFVQGYLPNAASGAVGAAAGFRKR